MKDRPFLAAMATTFSAGASLKISQNEREVRSFFKMYLYGILTLKFRSSIKNLTPVPNSAQTKIRTSTENRQILGLSVTRFEHDVILKSQLVISSSMLLFMADFTHF